MTVPKEFKLDDNAKQLLGLKPFEGLEDEGFDLELPIQLLPFMTIDGLSVDISGLENAKGAMQEELDQAKAAVEQALRGVQMDLQNALNAALKSSAWKWRDGGARDIYDTGALLRSGKVVLNGNTLSVSYGVPYASIVHDGGYIFPYGNKNLRPIYLPGRPWVSSTLYGGGPVPQFDFRASLMRHLKM